ncbi:MAG: phytanoyl-CoA dioxygenase family protein [Runella slithyformis]|nr:MAG: phytanoyl-CoA dioxygenase family protein [Runella slithyformis]TAG20474.1 MAG: phytanoyl-CoA dioxygenase family protein [Cytophagales bacterium]TAG39670.1 MAG: phytanoyl-CoA dioxygenase family protein [Cytophagia bacterium]TAF30042.1 MAG: phytanoyl-CoA dioxygenase family protein [Runella slithyformis]TAF49158.1 MAG: phytanoyl-CoA dioxygenase family protein [Runella slithyformis]
MQLTPHQIEAFHRDGYVIAKGFFTPQETAKLYATAIEDEAISQHSYNVVDQSGKKSKLALWFTPGDDIYGLMARSERMVNGVSALLGGTAPVCHFHSKLMQKEPKVGGAWEWHQDYGYWYKNQFLFPEQMLSVMVAFNDATIENGCLQVIKGSHKLGRVNHGFAGEQVGADAVMVENCLKSGMELVYVELKAGDALFFHSNLLHRSDANLSEKSRWSFISAYNLASNVPFNEKSTACITPISIVPDTALLTANLIGKGNTADFLSKDTDVTLQ